MLSVVASGEHRHLHATAVLANRAGLGLALGLTVGSGVKRLHELGPPLVGQSMGATSIAANPCGKIHSRDQHLRRNN